MDLRDQFAIAAMQAALGQIAELGPEPMKLVAAEAYEMADAMIAEREKDDVETKDQIKQMLVEAIKENHPGLNTAVFLPA
ncbi:MAG: hypothetical protein JNJ93_00780, partial [Acinetobacter sp.]|nr:hypothetical protein [Acinetobacter sp.]